MSRSAVSSLWHAKRLKDHIFDFILWNHDCRKTSKFAVIFDFSRFKTHICSTLTALLSRKSPNQQFFSQRGVSLRKIMLFYHWNPEIK